MTATTTARRVKEETTGVYGCYNIVDSSTMTPVTDGKEDATKTTSVAKATTTIVFIAILFCVMLIQTTMTTSNRGGVIQSIRLAKSTTGNTAAINTKKPSSTNPTPNWSTASKYAVSSLSSSAVKTATTKHHSSSYSPPTDVVEPVKVHKLPNVLIAGAQKGGTTSIAEYLRQITVSGVRGDTNAAVCFSHGNSPRSRSEGKETHFFDEEYNKGLSYYESLFTNCQGDATSEPAPFVVDGTPATMKYSHRVKQIYDEATAATTYTSDLKQELKIIISLREPVSREISWYNHRLRKIGKRDFANTILCSYDSKGNYNITSAKVKSFYQVARDEVYGVFHTDEVINRSNASGAYVKFFEELLQFFNRDQILIVGFDELQNNPSSYFGRIHKFLNLPGLPPAPDMYVPVANRDNGKSPEVDCAVQRVVGSWMEPYNDRLYKLLRDNPGPDMEQHPFPKFINGCWGTDEVLANNTKF